MEFDEKTVQINQIEGQNESNCVKFVSSKAASWPILLGSLDDTVNCESSLSAADSDDNSGSPKSGVVLRRPSHDCGPCEIKISFEQKHEIRQVYVRSTARVYEIYYAADIQSMNEYLCTVRCGMAAKTEECLANEYLQNMPAATSISPSSTGSNKLSEELKTDSAGSTNEDGWVEIKDPDPSVTEDGDSSLSNKTEVPVETENQDFYEATAELSDVNPCTSITIRLLSLQSGESAYLDEVYVFADPIECDDVASTSKEVDFSTANPLMSMLVPTLLQLSRSQASNLSKQPDPTTKSKNLDLNVSQNMSSASTSAKILKEEIQSVSIEQPTSSKVPTQNVNTHDNSGTTNDHIGKTLDQLVSRIARIEEFCLSFEQKMINPIINMDSRLGAVEQQLKLLNEKFSSVHSDGIGNIIPNSKVESVGKDDDASLVPYVITAPDLSVSSLSIENDDCFNEEVSDSARSHWVPSLVITAPEFSYGEEEEEEEGNDDAKSVVDSPCDNKFKKPVSIDEALADAFAGFVSSTSTFDPDNSKNDNVNDQSGAKNDVVIIENSVDAAAENREHDALLFCSHSEPTVEIIAEETVAEVQTMTKEKENDKKEDALHGILELPINSVVNYEIPILDVKFAPRESSNLNSSIEALLTETADQDCSVEPDDNEVLVIESGNQLLVDLGHDDSICMSCNDSKEDVSVALL